MMQVAGSNSKTGMVYADRYQLTDGVRRQVPVIDYQTGSLRDDFDFGSLLLFHAEAFRHAAKKVKASYKARSEEHTSELQSRQYLVCRLLLEKKKKKKNNEREIKKIKVDCNTKEEHTDKRNQEY